MTQWHAHGGLPELVAASDVIVRGTVTAKAGEHELRPTGERIPVARTEFLVRADLVLKGNPPAELLVVQDGREGDTANTYPEFPLLVPGREVLLFLEDVTNEPPLVDGKLRYSIFAVDALYSVTGGRVTSGAPDYPVTRGLSGKSWIDVEREVRSLSR